MKIFYTKHLPVKGFRAINLFGVIFARKEFSPLPKYVLNHEAIHTRQLVELLFFGFYIWYLTEWLIRWIQYKDKFLAYKNISFEREAYENDDNFEFLSHRPVWNFIKYIKKEKYIEQ